MSTSIQDLSLLISRSAQNGLQSSEIVEIVVFSIVFVICLIIFFTCLCMSCKIVRQAQVMVIERFGKFKKILKPGIHFILPVIDQPRRIHWRYLHTPIGHTEPIVKTVSSDRVDLREHCIDFGKQHVITRDTVPISIDALVYYQITSPKRAVFNIQNLPDAIELLTQTSLRNIIAKLTLDDTFSSREQISDVLRERTLADAGRWGVSIIRVEIQNIITSKDIKTAMENQIISERTRRSTVLGADGERESSVIESRGRAAQIVLRSEGEKTSRIQIAKGEAEWKISIFNAEAQCIQILREAITNAGIRATDYLVALQYLNVLKTSTASNKPATVVLLPHEIVHRVKRISDTEESDANEARGGASGAH
eukprot:gnl/Trimastix_PCT/671.p2 GENE.gnl/Trimastix_PCT/671~~gnl/Trimastix_PCT/671.p2  ORF type:complete len:366 (+),score=122.47 gnl/Trimastix_PCT/671:79-1176(+)